MAFGKAILYGAAAKLERTEWNRFSGFLSNARILGNAWFPVTGGLLLGADAVIPARQFVGAFQTTVPEKLAANYATFAP